MLRLIFSKNASKSSHLRAVLPVCTMFSGIARAAAELAFGSATFAFGGLVFASGEKNVEFVTRIFGSSELKLISTEMNLLVNKYMNRSRFKPRAIRTCSYT